MIQRIQSLYLFAAAIMISMLLFFPVADFWGDISYQFSAMGFHDLSPEADSPFHPMFSLPLFVFTICLTLLPLVAIVLYKNRKKQLLIIRLTLGLIIALLILIFFYYIPTIEKEILLTADYISAFGMFFPLLALFFIVLAQRGVIKDEKMIKSMDRLR